MIELSASLLSSPRDSGYIDNQNELLVTSCGRRRCLSRDYALALDSGRLDFLLIYLRAGRGLFKLNGRMQALGRGGLLLYQPTMEVNYLLLAHDQPELYWLSFTGRHAKGLVERLRLHRGSLLAIEPAAEPERLFESVLAELQRKRPFFQEQCQALLVELLASAARTGAEGRGGAGARPGIQAAAEYLARNFRRGAGIDELARLAGLSRYRFLHRFKQLAGCPALEYLARLRVEEAKSLLEGTELRIGEVAELVGYENPLYFSKVFKKRSGLSPLAWRRNRRRALQA